MRNNSRAFHIRPYHFNGLNWTLASGEDDKDNIVVVTGFMPSWWEREYGIRFGSDFHLDPDTHRTTLSKMQSLLEERFGNLPGFLTTTDYAHSFPIERRYGDGLIPALFGASVSFDDASGHPYAECLKLSDEQVERLEPPDVENHPVVSSFLDEKKGGFLRTSGEPGFEGVINIAYKLRGEEMFVDMLQKPALARHLFEVVFETIRRTVLAVRTWQDPAHARPSYFVNCDCLINMISGDMYRGYLIEYEKRFSECFELFGVHTCNWKIDPYLDSLAGISGLAYVDMGAESDLEKVHRLFPSLRPAVFFHPERVRRLSPRDLRKEIGELARKIVKGYILLSDLEEGTSDGQIRAVYDEASRF